MHLKLYREDLKPEYEDIPTQVTRFEYFNEQAQQAIILVGRATFVTNEGTRLENYNAIYPPTEAVKP